MNKQLVVMIATGLVMSHGLTGAAPIAPIVEAAATGDAAALERMLRIGGDVSEAQGDGMTALHWAAERGDVDIARMLIRAGANFTAGTRIGSYTPLHIASRNGHAAIVGTMLAAGADPEVATINSGARPLHLAAASSSPETVRLLLEAGAEVDAREGSWQQTPLIFAAGANRVDNMRLLIAAGADVSVTTKVVDTAAREKADKAAEKRIVEVLAEFKARAGGDASWRPSPREVQGAIEFSRDVQRNWPHVPDPACDPPKDASADENKSRENSVNPETEHCIKEDGSVGTFADAEATRATQAQATEPEPRPRTYGELVGHWGGLTPLLQAVRQGYSDAALLLLDAGADINQASAGDHTTPLLMAAVNGQFDLALVLLERGADPNIGSKAGATPLFAALERQWAAWAHYAHPVEYLRQEATYLDLMQALLEAGADPNPRLDKNLWYAEYTTSVLTPAGLHYDGATPFWRAAFALDVDAMKLLRVHGADPMIPTRKTPERRRNDMRNPMPEDDEEEEEDPTGLEPVPVGGPFVYPLHAASGAGYGLYFMAHAHRHAPDNWLNAVRYLIEEVGYDVNMRDANGYTPLHHAAARGDNELIQYLMEQGADVKVVARSGQTTADMANGPTQRVTPFPETIELLVGLGAVNNNSCVSC